jgi:hypothetical protein
MKNDLNKFIYSIPHKIFDKIRHSKSDAECRRYLLEHASKQLELTAVVQAKPEKVCAMCNQSKEDDGHNCCEDCGGVSL